MSLSACQRDAYRRTLSARVLSCQQDDDAWWVELDDTVLYAEGGGQPSDRGTIGGVNVLQVVRDEQGAVFHLTDGPVPLGPTEVWVDWERRYDHMQQHSAQHLISALAEDLLGRPTTGFHLGEEISDVQLGGEPLSPQDLGRLQSEINAVVREARPVNLRVVPPEALAGLPVRTRGFKATGDVRLIEIEGVDLNTCGGTHVRSTAELQAVFLVRGERMKTGTRLHYLAGGRVLRALRGAQRREAELTALLRCGPAGHEERVTQLLEQQKDQTRDLRNLRRELAELLGVSLARRSADVVHMHRDDGDLRFLQSVASAATLERPRLTLLLTCGGPHDGFFLLAAPDTVIESLGGRVANVLGGRGGGARGRFQGRAEALDGVPRALAILRGELAPPTWESD